MIQVSADRWVTAATSLWQDDSGREQLTLIVSAAFALQHLGVATPLPADSAAARVADAASVKFAAEVVVVGAVRPGRAARTILGAAVARGCEVLWGKRMVASSVPGEPALLPFAGDSDGSAGFGLIGDQAQPDQQLPFLRGGEQLLITGFGASDVLARLPAVAPHALLAGPRAQAGAVFPLLGDNLHIDADRQIATLTWRGHVARPRGAATLQVQLLPLIEVEEVAGEPPSWRRSLWRAPPERPIFSGTAALPAATLPPLAGRMTVVVKGRFELIPGGPAQLTDPQEPLSGDRYDADDMHATMQYPSDFCLPKGHVDVIANGHIYARAGATVATSHLAIGSIDKRIVAIGPRQRERGGVLSEPAPFERVPLRHELAFGGPGFAANPIGTGRGNTPAPQLERPDELITSQRSKPRPACFAAISPHWPAREGGGHYDQRWLNERWPAPAADFDEAALSAAPPDQRCPALRGDEPFSISSVLPGAETLAGSLPGLRPWCFAQRRGGEVVPLELPLDTVVFDCDSRSVSLRWCGALPVATDAMPPRLWLSFGPVDAPPPLSRAWAQLNGAADPRFDSDVPAVRACDVAEVRALLRQQRERTARLSQPIAAEPPAIEPPAREQVLQWLASPAGLAGRDLSGVDLSGIDLSDQDLNGTILAQALLGGARFDRARCQRLNLAGAMASHSSWLDADLSQADASGADLRGADLSRAELAGATLSHADLSGAKLVGSRGERIDAAHARLCGAQFEGAVWPRSDLSGCQLDDCSFAQALLDDAKFYDSHGSAVVLDGASLQNARLDGARLPGLSAVGVRAAGSAWTAADLTGAHMPRAALKDAVMNDACLDKAMLDDMDGRGLRLRHASLRGSSLLRANLMQADLQACDLRQADLRHANLYEAETLAARLDGARLEHSHIKKTKLAADKP